MQLRLGGKDDILSTSLGTDWKLLRPPWCPHPQASLNQEVRERVRLMSLSGTDSIVHRVVKPLLDMGCGGNPFNKASRSSTEGHSLRGELHASAAMD